MLATQTQIEALALRIEQAYRLRRPHWGGSCSTRRVWAAAAAVLRQAHESDPGVPPDPELYVASQPDSNPYPDPWAELTSAEALGRYRDWVRSIVGALRRELVSEVWAAEEQIGAGRPVGRVLAARNRKLSPLGRYVVARRAGQTVLAERYAAKAAEQHHACPLYREAVAGLLPPGAYPVVGPDRPAPALPLTRRPRAQAHWN